MNTEVTISRNRLMEYVAIDTLESKRKRDVAPFSLKCSETVEILINADGALAFVIRGWFDQKESLELCEKLRKEVKWEKHEVTIMGRKIMQPRRIYACGDKGLIHRYSGLTLPVKEWIPKVKEICDRIVKEMGIEFNACLMNEYCSGADYISWHSDKEALGTMNSVVSVSLGGARDFYFRHKIAKGLDVKTTLQSGDCVVMYGECQKYWLHSIPKRAKADYRISLTYRFLVK